MKTNKPDLQMFESTYAMIMRSEEKERSASEVLVYSLLIAAAFFSLIQITLQPFNVPTNFGRATSMIQSAGATHPRV
jgi:hypothetical protein